MKVQKIEPEGVKAMNKEGLYQVVHPDYGEIVVAAEDGAGATVAAAERWVVPWRTVAGYCTVTHLGQAAKKRCRRCGMETPQDGLCLGCQQADKLYRMRQKGLPKIDRRAGAGQRN